MNELLILYVLQKSSYTMYRLSKVIEDIFGFITRPSFGTLQPALKRLEKKNFLKIEKMLSDGGRPFFYYSIKPDGLEFLKLKIKEPLSTNPIQAYPYIKIKLICSDILDIEEQKKLYRELKSEVNVLKQYAEESKSSDTFTKNDKSKKVLENSIKEYDDILKLILEFENAGNS